MKFEEISLKQLKITPATIEKLEKINLRNGRDLIFHLPRSFEDRTIVSMIADLSDKSKGIFELLVLSSYTESYGKKRLFKVNAHDEKGTEVQLIFTIIHKKTDWIHKYFVPNQIIKVFGELQIKNNPFMRSETYSIFHPEIVFPSSKPNTNDKLTPIYRTTSGLQQSSIRNAISKVLPMLGQLEEYRPQNGWPSVEIDGQVIDINDLTLSQALLCLHNPSMDMSAKDILTAKSPHLIRLIAEEILAVQCSMAIEKSLMVQEKSMILPLQKTELNRVVLNLPFKLTSAQKRVMQEITNDLESGKAMYRLVHGDVGSGKSIIAALSAGIAVVNGAQVAILAPTDILAGQLANTVEDALAPLNIKITTISGKLKSSQRKERLAQIANNQIQIICGTHAIFSSGIEFDNLGLVIIDEQHKFGVEQRNKLRNKQQKFAVHQLMLSATPIPRTMAQVQYANMDLSKLDETPPGKLPIDTRLISQNRKDQIVGFLQRALAENRQIYWIAALVEESEKSDMSSIESSYEYLRLSLPNAKIEIVHGRQKSEEKDKAMDSFARGEADILIATTVVEVGINVPNSTVIIIDNAERYGLAQLHQLRGRVGRGTQQSFCLMLFKPDISAKSIERLVIMRDSNDGFEIAQADLAQRGFGDIFGVRQHGELDLKFSNLARDVEVVDALGDLANQICISEPELAYKLVQRWKGNHIDLLKS